MEKLKEAALSQMKKLGLRGDVYMERIQKNEAAVQDGHTERISSSDSFGMGIRVFKNGLMGFGFTTINSTMEVRELVGRLGASASVPGYGDYELPGQAEMARIKLYDPAFDAATAGRLREKAAELEAAAMKIAGVKYVRDASVTGAKITNTYFNTSGMEYSFDRSMFTAYLSAIASGKNEEEAVDVMETSALFDYLDARLAGKSAGTRASTLLGGGPVPTGRYMIVLPNYTAVDFLYVLSSMFYGSNARKGKSLLKDCREGDAIASDIVNIADSGILPYGAQSFPCDGEGNPAMETKLVTAGKFTGFLYDALNAGLMKKRATGNGIRASFKSLPETGTSNFYMEPGKTSAADITKNGKCIVINSLMGLHMTDTISGNFSLGMNGWLYEGGNMVQPVKECLITGNIREFLKNITAAGDDLKFYGNFGAPTIAVDDIIIAGK
ncbi:MAG: TldD/PmbA family protein [Spirochaetia bacterium]|nr:TldD/PmbA family protein [Spirochaetia bacterium]